MLFGLLKSASELGEEITRIRRKLIKLPANLYQMRLQALI